jgi:HD superfamily phosphodiesterase
MEEAREKALQELTEYYEGKIKEKNRELKQASDDHEQEQRKLEEIQKQTEEDTDHEILTLKNTYERDLKKQIDANMKLRGELGIKTKKVTIPYATC